MLASKNTQSKRNAQTKTLDNVQYAKALRAAQQGDLRKVPQNATQRQAAAITKAMRSQRLIKTADPHVLKNGVVPKDMIVRALNNPHYSQVYQHNFGRGPVPRPFHTTGSARKVIYPSAGTAWKTYTLAAADACYIQAVPYHGAIAFLIKRPVDSGAASPTTYIQYPNPGDVLLAYGQFVADPRSMTQAGFQAAVDRYGFPSVDDTSAGAGYANQFNLGFNQLLGGKMEIELAVPYGGSAVFNSIHANEVPMINGDSCITQPVIRARDPPGFHAQMVLPSFNDTGAGYYGNLAERYGNSTTVMGNAVRRFTSGLPHDRGWYHWGLPKSAVGYDEDTTPYTFNGGFAPTGAVFNNQFGTYFITNTGTTTVTIKVRVDMTWASTFADLGQEGTTGAGNDPLRIALLMKAKSIAANVGNGVKSGVRQLVDDASKRSSNTAANTQLKNDAHHVISAAEATVGGGALEVQTGAFSKALAKIKGLFGSAGEAIEGTVVKEAPLLESAGEELMPLAEMAI